MSLRLLRTVFVGGMFVLAAACSEPQTESVATGDEEVGDARAAIQGGYTDADDRNVVGIYDETYGAICTGSLLAPNMVLTARHCVSNLIGEVQGGVSCSTTKGNGNWPANGFLVFTEGDMFTAYFQNKYVKASEVVLLEDPLLCGNDQAILILAENIPASDAVPLIPRVDSPLVANEEYVAIGYGQSSESNQNSAGTRRRRDNLRVYCAETGCTGGGIQNYVKTTEWVGDTGICSGDSGGPALDMQNRVVGVTSRGGPNCSDPVYGSVHSWGDWIKNTALHAAEVGGYDAPMWAQGWPTDPGWSEPVGGDCKENGCTTCWDNTCTRFCSDQFGCPDQFECKLVQDNTSVCVAIPPPPPDTGSGSGGDSDSGDSGCAVGAGAGTDPTNPVPWFTGMGGVAALALLRAKRRARPSKRG